MEDPIVEETREARRELDAEFNGDLAALFAYLQEIERENSALVCKLDPKPPESLNRKVS
jgi:hypothetical protein